MDKLTAIRSFAQPSYCPAKRVKIFNDRWYLVKMQNVERGPGDYMGLGEGEYTELLPGAKARERRDSRLNHCNAIAEYKGDVFEAFANQYGGDVRSIGWFATPQAALDAVTAKRDAHDKWIADCKLEMKRHLLAAEAMRNGTGISIMSAELHEQAANDCVSVIDRHSEAFRCDIKGVKFEEYDVPR